MKVRFEEDYRDYGKTALLIWKKHNKKSNEPFYQLITAAFFAAITSIPTFLFAPHFIFTSITFCLVFAICFYFYKSVNLKYFVEYYRSIYNEEILATEVEISENGVEVLMPGLKVFYEWKNIADFEETEENLYLISKFHSGISVPKNAFQSNAEIGNFIAFTKAHISTQQAKQLNDRNNQQSAQS